MCLAIKQGVPEQTEGFGWKIFRQPHKGGKLRSNTFGPAEPRPRRTWLQATDAHVGGFYPRGKADEAGFHIYLDRQDAFDKLNSFSRKVVRKVRYRGAFLQGTGDGSSRASRARIVVAREIYIIEANRA